MPENCCFYTYDPSKAHANARMGCCNDPSENTGIVKISLTPTFCMDRTLPPLILGNVSISAFFTATLPLAFRLISCVAFTSSEGDHATKSPFLTSCPKFRTGWQKLAASRRKQHWPQNFRQACVCYFRDKFVVIARNCQFANLIQYNMHNVPCNSALLAQEALIPKNHFYAQSLPKGA